MNLNNLNKLIADILSYSESEINDDSKLEDIPNWDSMNHMILITKIEEKYGVLFTGDEIIEMVDIKSIKYFLKNKGIN
tara:strand:- start:43 stop:276 length:234 start_codon:yes stop_codon:yes gene_type:complete